MQMNLFPIILINSNHFPLPGTCERFLHLATLQRGFKEFMVFKDRWTEQVYIEEITGGHGPLRIEDDQLAEELAAFVRERGILDMSIGRRI